MIETLIERNKRLDVERRLAEGQESSRRQGAQIDRLNYESAQREGERQKLQGLLSDEYELVAQLRGAGAGNPELEKRLTEVQQQIEQQAKIVSKFDPAWVATLGL